MNRCLFCYQHLDKNEVDYHPRCSNKIYGDRIPPVNLYSEKDIDALALNIIKSASAVTGVQPKLSLSIEKSVKENQRKFTIVDLQGDYILKPASNYYKELTEVEDLTMHLAEIAKIKVVPHSLIRMASGELAYITKRIDRTSKSKVHMEDMCQITERLTEHKYQSSHEQIAKAIKKHSDNPGLDVINFYEIVLFSFLVGNADMHLKNFSLIQRKEADFVLSPAYDLVSTAIVNPADKEELALTLNAKKSNLKLKDFNIAFSAAGIDDKQQESIFKKMHKAKNSWLSFIEISFLSKEFKLEYIDLINKRFKRLAQ